MVKTATQMGVIFFSDGVTNKGQAAVREAAANAGIDEGLVRDLRPRNIFLRAMADLKRQGIIAQDSTAQGELSHKLIDDETTVEFQLTQFFVEAHGVKYDPLARVAFNKVTNEITCPNGDIAALAQDLYMKEGAVFQAYDIHAICRRLLAVNGCRQIILRDAVYFIPYQHELLANKIKKFMELLGFPLFVFPVGQGSTEAPNLVKAVVRDIKATVEGYKAEIARLKADSTLTKRVAQNRVADLRTALRQYRVLAEALQVDAQALLDASGEAGKIVETVGMSSEEELVSSLRQGQKLNGLVYDLIAAANPDVVPVALQRPAVSKVEPDGE